MRSFGLLLTVGVVLFFGLFIQSIANKPAVENEMKSFQPALVAVQKHNELVHLIANQ